MACNHITEAEWVLVFADQDRGEMVFNDSKEAYDAFARYKANWTCALFQRVASAAGYSPIKDPCPVCHRLYEWDAEQDAYIGARGEGHYPAGYSEASNRTRCNRTTTLSICPDCEGVIAVEVHDEVFGSQPYVPSGKAL